MASPNLIPTSHFRIPDLVKNWPFKRTLNPAFDAIKLENNNWTRSLNIKDAKLERGIEKARIALIAALVYPLVPPQVLQLGADIMTTFLIYDDISDNMTEDEVIILNEIIKDVFRDPERERPERESVIGKLHQSFWNRARKNATTTFLRHFPQRYLKYSEAVREQARDRDDSRVRDIDAYMYLRRNTFGGMPSFCILLHSLNVSDEELSGPKIMQLELLAGDLIILANDICSYNVEQSRGDNHNAVAVVMHQQMFSVQEAVDFVAQMFYESADRFLQVMSTVLSPSQDLQIYILGLANWVQGNFEMSFEIKRYGLGAEARKGGWVEVFPKKILAWKYGLE